MTRQRYLPSLVRAGAAEHPDRIFVEEVGGSAYTWADFDAANRRWAAAYERVGVAAGDRVVTMLPSSIEASAAWLGLGWLRAIEAPCNLAYRGRMLEHLLSDAETSTVVIDGRLLDRLAEVAPSLPDLRTVVVLGDVPAEHGLSCRVVGETEFFDGVTPADDLPDPEAWDICALFYTSGTTGRSKGVLAPWGQMHAQGIGFLPMHDFGEDDAYFMPYPMNHISGKTPVYSMAVLHGRVVIRDGFDTGTYWDDVDRHGCTTTGMLGAMPAFLWQQPVRDDDADHVLEKVWMAPLVPYLDEFKARFGVRVTTSYGSVEHSVPIRAGHWDTSSATWRSCGKLREGWPGYELRLVDEHDEEVAPGATGELIVRTSAPWTMNAGYLGIPDKTADAWRNGWFHTGDAFTCDAEGNYYFVDRTRDCIRRRGENVSSFEVEGEVNAHPTVAESAAIGVPSEVGEEEIKVLVVAQEGADVDPEDLIRFLIPRMPRFMVPRYVEVVAELPKTDATLRVKKYLLRDDPINAATWDREVAGIRIPR
jgi:crotonobetaine/carnitine-CoA ligase